MNKDNIHRDLQLFKKYQQTAIKKCGIPNNISENLIKYMIEFTTGDNITWNCKKGDLFSDKRGQIECKCFTSNGPISFSPKFSWGDGNLYFLDARDYQNDNYTLYLYTGSTKDFGKIKINKSQDMNSQMAEKRRPRINWKELYPQIENKLKKVFDGNIYPTILERSFQNPIHFQADTLQATAFVYQPLEAIKLL
jgi:hypothetical protein